MFKAQIEYAPYLYLLIKACGGGGLGLKERACGLRRYSCSTLQATCCITGLAPCSAALCAPQDDLEMAVDGWVRRKFEGSIKEVEVVEREDLDLVRQYRAMYRCRRTGCGTTLLPKRVCAGESA